MNNIIEYAMARTAKVRGLVHVAERI